MAERARLKAEQHAAPLPDWPKPECLGFIPANPRPLKKQFVPETEDAGMDDGDRDDGEGEEPEDDEGEV